MKLSSRKILDRAAALLPELVALRRHLHANPELSYHEHATALFITTQLTGMNIPIESGIAGTGIVGYIEGRKKGGGRTIALRAEMDALPVHEENDVPYLSLNEGVMHACGHDAHMAMLLGTATILSEMKGQFGGKIVLLFQPGEEKSPGGAKLMIESGILDRTPPDIVLASHILPELETGCVGYRGGRYMASADEIHITISGRGGHAALQAEVTDQTYITSELILTLRDTITAEQKLRGVDTVFTFGKIEAHGATNVIPQSVTIAGTLRTFSEEWRSDAIDLVRKISAAVAKKYGVVINADIGSGYPVLVNSQELAAAAAGLSSQLLGADRVKEMKVRMSSDDFAFYTLKYPSLYYRVGIAAPGAGHAALHTSRFDIDEQAMVTGVANMAWLTLNFSNPRYVIKQD
ncbi:MAG: amidohydrolase [Bacteroidetes bacterium]|nr:amidohydrolase [Bacteroidota bacterium]